MKKIDDILYKQIWEISAGSTWKPSSALWFMDHFEKLKKKGIKSDVKMEYPDAQKVDIIVKTYLYSTSWEDCKKTEPIKIFVHETKDLDMHSSLFPKIDILQKETTSLVREFVEHYVPFDADYKYLIYVTTGMTGKDLRKLDSIMSHFPDIRRKSYSTQQMAITGIYNLAKKDVPPFNLAKPPYTSVGDYGIARSLANSLKAFSMEFANAIVESQNILCLKDAVDKLNTEVILKEGKKFYSRKIAILSNEINYRLHGGEKPQSLIKKEKKEEERKELKKLRSSFKITR